MLSYNAHISEWGNVAGHLLAGCLFCGVIYARMVRGFTVVQIPPSHVSDISNMLPTNNLMCR